MPKFRLWDTEHTRVVWAVANAEPNKFYQVWTNEDGSKLYIYYKGKWAELTPSEGVTIGEMGPLYKALEDETVGFYLTNKPTELFNWDEGGDVAYQFLNGSDVLDSGTIKEGETPEYTGETPTKEATAQYTYTFSGWKPTVGPIYKKTDFKAQFSKEVNTYTVTIAVNDDTYGHTEPATITSVPYGVAVAENEDHTLSIGTATVTPTAESGYVFKSWGTLPETITGNTTITATFEAEGGGEK